METLKPQAFSIDMENPSCSYTLASEKIGDVKLPSFLQNRLSKNQKPKLTK